MPARTPGIPVMNYIRMKASVLVVTEVDLGESFGPCGVLPHVVADQSRQPSRSHAREGPDRPAARPNTDDPSAAWSNGAPAAKAASVFSSGAMA